MHNESKTNSVLFTNSAQSQYKKECVVLSVSALRLVVVERNFLYGKRGLELSDDVDDEKLQTTRQQQRRRDDKVYISSYV